MSTRSRVVVVVAAVIVAAMGGLVAWRSRPHSAPVPFGFVVAMQAVDDGAVLVWWGGDENHTFREGFVSRVDARGETVWWKPMHDEALSGDSLAVGDGIVSVRYTHRTANAPFGSDQAVAAYSFADGHVLWERTLVQLDASTEHAEPDLGTYATAAFVGDRLVEFVGGGAGGNVVVVLDPQSGQVIAQHPWREIMASTVIVGQWLFQHATTTVASLDVERGQTTEFETGGTGCAIRGEYVTVESDPGRGALVAFAAGDRTKKRVIKAAFDPRPPGDKAEWFILRRCGTYGDKLVLTLDATLTDMETERLVVVTTAAGEILHTIRLVHDTDWDGESIAKRYYEHASLAGELTRFVPYISVVGTGDDEIRLVMLDLEQGAIAWESPPDQDLLQAHLFRDADRWYLISSFYRDLITEIDGQSGAVVAAVRAHAYEGTTLLTPAHLHGRLWIANEDHVHVDHASLVALDERTLQPLVKSPAITVTDMTAEQKAKLRAAK